LRHINDDVRLEIINESLPIVGSSNSLQKQDGMPDVAMAVLTISISRPSISSLPA
jgi:hypothetical protein